MTTSPRDSRSIGIASRVTTNAPRRLTSSWRSHFFVVSWSIVARDPDAGGVDEDVEAAEPLDVLLRRRARSRRRTRRSPSPPARRAHRQLPRAVLRSARRASASKPSSRSIRAIARPMPDEPPVMSAAAHGAILSRFTVVSAEARSGGAAKAPPSPLKATAAVGRRRSAQSGAEPVFVYGRTDSVRLLFRVPRRPECRRPRRSP